MAKALGCLPDPDPDLGPPFPPKVPEWVKSLTPAHQVLYYKATLTYTKAHNTLDAAIATASVGRDAPYVAFATAKDLFQTAMSDLDSAKSGAAQAKSAIEVALAHLCPEAAGDATLAADQIAALQASVDGYKAAVSKVAQRVAAAQAASAALQKVSQIPASGVFDPRHAAVNEDAVALAAAQFQVDEATANEPWLIAVDDYEAKLAELKSYSIHGG